MCDDVIMMMSLISYESGNLECAPNSHPPQLYGLPKIHKMGIPLRPIVSSIGSATYRLVRELARILTPLKGQCSSYIRNSSHFVERIRKENIQESDLMVSFNVKSLFTKVPIQEALQVIEKKLLDDTWYVDVAIDITGHL